MSDQEKSKKEIQLEEQLKNEQRIAKYEINQLHYKLQGQKDKNSANIGLLALVIFCLAVIVLGLA